MPRSLSGGRLLFADLLTILPDNPPTRPVIKTLDALISEQNNGRFTGLPRSLPDGKRDPTV